MPKVTNIFTGFSTVCGDTMAEKKDPGKFTVRFNICDPQHKAVVDLLNQQGRSKAQFLTNAVLHYINCTEAPELHRRNISGWRDAAQKPVPSSNPY